MATAAGGLVSAHAGELERMGLAPAWATLQVGRAECDCASSAMCWNKPGNINQARGPRCRWMTAMQNVVRLTPPPAGLSLRQHAS